jgi:hypothetical protein
VLLEDPHHVPYSVEDLCYCRVLRLSLFLRHGMAVLQCFPSNTVDRHIATRQPIFHARGMKDVMTMQRPHSISCLQYSKANGTTRRIVIVIVIVEVVTRCFYIVILVTGSRGETSELVLNVVPRS